MNYNVFGGMLNLAPSVYPSLRRNVSPVLIVGVVRCVYSESSYSDNKCRLLQEARRRLLCVVMWMRRRTSLYY